MSRLTTLPPELLEHIFEPLAAHSLTALARTSTAFYHSASRLLYRRVSISSFARNLGAVATLAARPHLALLVRHFSICLDDDGTDQPDSEYYKALEHALRGMEGLVSLDLNVHGECSWILAAPPLVYSRLESFSCSFPLDTPTASFLDRTPQLRSLQVAASPNAVPLSPSAVPHLTTYTGPSSLLAQLLPSRPITSLHLSGDLALDDIAHLAADNRSSAPSTAAVASTTVSQASASASTQTRISASAPAPAPASAPAPAPAAVAPGTGPECVQSAEAHGANVRIETLSTITSAPPVAVIEALAKACPSLVCLRVITTCTFWETPDITFYARIASCLSSLPSLRAFELSGMHWEFRPKTASAADGTCAASGKEWISPPVTPRAVELDAMDSRDREFAFDEAFMEWAY